MGTLLVLELRDLESGQRKTSSGPGSWASLAYAEMVTSGRIHEPGFNMDHESTVTQSPIANSLFSTRGEVIGRFYLAAHTYSF